MEENKEKEETVIPLEKEETPTETPVYTRKKDFVYTEKRKENIAKANAVRKQNQEKRKQFKDELEKAKQDLQIIYEKTLNIPTLKMDSENKKEPEPEIKIESVLSKSSKKGKKVEACS